jgi:hypothetical protein
MMAPFGSLFFGDKSQGIVIETREKLPRVITPSLTLV